MLITSIAALLSESTTSVMFTVARDGERVRCVVAPHGKLSSPVAITGTPEELDAELLTVLTGIRSRRITAEDALKQAETELRASIEASKKELAARKPAPRQQPAPPKPVAKATVTSVNKPKVVAPEPVNPTETPAPTGPTAEETPCVLDTDDVFADLAAA